MQQLGFRAEFITFWCSNQVARLSFVTALFLISPCKCDILLLRVYKETTNKQIYKLQWDPNADNVSWASSFQDMGPGRMGHWDIQLLLLLFL